MHFENPVSSYLLDTLKVAVEVFQKVNGVEHQKKWFWIQKRMLNSDPQLSVTNDAEELHVGFMAINQDHNCNFSKKIIIKFWVHWSF